MIIMLYNNIVYRDCTVVYLCVDAFMLYTCTCIYVYFAGLQSLLERGDELSRRVDACRTDSA